MSLPTTMMTIQPLKNDDAINNQQQNNNIQEEHEDNEDNNNNYHSEIEIVFEPDNNDNHDSDKDFEVEETNTVEDIIEESTEEPSRSNRAPKPREFLQPSMKGKTYIQTEADIECCHNLITQISPNPEEDEQYCPSNAMLIARMMVDINHKFTLHGTSFGQQHMIHKGLKLFGEKDMMPQTRNWINYIKEHVLHL